MATYARKTPLGEFRFGNWNSFGSNANRETDLEVGWAAKGFEVQLSRYFLYQLGDLVQLAVTKSGTIGIGKRKLPLGATFIYYSGVDGSSPQGGSVVQLSTGFEHSVGRLQFRHRVSATADNNPFGMGEGISSIGIYTVEAGYKCFFGAWHSSVPVAGRDNTSRVFRQSVSAGCRYSFAW